MNKNQVKGKIEQVKGAVQREWGKATDNTSDQVKGTVKKAAGELRETFGNKQEADAKADDS